MADILTEEQIGKKRRLISILCIVGFVINGFSLFDNALAYKSPDVMAAMLKDQIQKDKIQLPVFTPDVSNRLRITAILDNYADHAVPATVATSSVYAVFSAIICLVGLFLLYNKNRLGFHFFIIGTLIGILAPFLLFGGSAFSLVLAIFRAFSG